MQVWEIIRDRYDPLTQISTGQSYLVATALAACGPAAHFLIFGCGHDSPMWHALNHRGKTLFVEDHPEWLTNMRCNHPQLWVEAIDYGGRTVAQSLPIREEELAVYSLPSVLNAHEWDVILVDGPAGYNRAAPGRSLSIYWASLIACERTHVFLDDYHRPLEKAYGDHFLRSRRLWNIEVPRVTLLGKRSSGVMLWSVAAPVFPYQQSAHP